jgi:ribonuclease E
MTEGKTESKPRRRAPRRTKDEIAAETAGLAAPEAAASPAAEAGGESAEKPKKRSRKPAAKKAAEASPAADSGASEAAASEVASEAPAKKARRPRKGVAKADEAGAAPEHASAPERAAVPEPQPVSVAAAPERHASGSQPEEAAGSEPGGEEERQGGRSRRRRSRRGGRNRGGQQQAEVSAEAGVTEAADSAVGSPEPAEAGEAVAAEAQTAPDGSAETGEAGVKRKRRRRRRRNRKGKGGEGQQGSEAASSQADEADDDGEGDDEAEGAEAAAEPAADERPAAPAARGEEGGGRRGRSRRRRGKGGDGPGRPDEAQAVPADEPPDAEPDVESPDDDDFEGDAEYTDTSGSSDSRKVMMIDGVHREEIRVAIVNDTVLDYFEFENQRRKQFKGNIYKGKVINIAPAIEAAFVEFGGGRHGFLPLNEYCGGALAENLENWNEGEKRPTLRSGMEILVQVTKEESTVKGAALTSYISIAGRYLVMMLGMKRFGISKKITSEKERERLRKVMDKLEYPEHLGFIVRTEGEGRNLKDLKADLQNLIRLWHRVLDGGKSLKAPALLYEEQDIVIRTLRDSYSSDFAEVLMNTEDAHRKAVEFFDIY